MNKPKILTIDIETKPALAYVWGLFDQNISINQLVDASAPICVAAKWLGDKEIFFYSDWETGHVGMLAEIHNLLSEADAVVGYNSDSFDLKKLNGEFLLHGFNMVPPLTSIDLIKTIRKMGFQSTKLAYVGPLLALGAKVTNEGFGLWKKCMDGNVAAQKKMRRYNIGDIKLTEKLYLKLIPFIKNHPFLGDRGHCGACNSTVLHKRGYRRTKGYRIERLVCNTCGSWQDGKREMVTAKKPEVKAVA